MQYEDGYWAALLAQFLNFFFFPTKIVTTLDSEPKQNVIRERASNMTGDPAPCAELEPTSSWSNKATILTPISFWRLLSEDVASINAWNKNQKILANDELMRIEISEIATL